MMGIDKPIPEKFLKKLNTQTGEMPLACVLAQNLMDKKMHVFLEVPQSGEVNPIASIHMIHHTDWINGCVHINYETTSSTGSVSTPWEIAEEHATLTKHVGKEYDWFVLSMTP